MKKIIMALVICVLAIGAAHAFDKYTINRDALPEEARNMLDEYFPKQKVGMIKVDKHLLKKTDYDVKLVNGTKIEFSNSGKWTSVDCKSREVPSKLIVRPIRTYVQNNGNGAKIVKVVKKASGYEIGLSDGVELKFNLLGQFKGAKID
ncbi:MAG: PepSY-like domain-containing protein [Duncaniella sp.]|nr:PepSY-like domain-containing protein [Duncaniella sp.]